jgi:predicted ATPase
MDPGLLAYFGGKSLMIQSHGQSLMSFFKSRFKIKGLYLLDEPETALSPTSLIDLVKLLARNSRAGHAQFIIATHSPILLACPEAGIYRFNASSLEQVDYEETEHFQVYRSFMLNPGRYLQDV